MSDTGSHGRKLFDYLDMLRGTESMRSFVLAKNIDYASVMRWQTGDPSLEGMRQVADALALPLGEVLLVAGYGDASDFRGIEVRPATAPNAADAIEHDPTLTESEREALRAVLNLARQAAEQDGKGGRRRIPVR